MYWNVHEKCVAKLSSSQLEIENFTLLIHFIGEIEAIAHFSECIEAYAAFWGSTKLETQNE